MVAAPASASAALVYTRSLAAENSACTQGTISAQCPQGYSSIGGGVQNDESAFGEASPGASYPFGTRYWTEVTNVFFGVSHEHRAVAVCDSGSRSLRVTGPLTVNPSSG